MSARLALLAAAGLSALTLTACSDDAASSADTTVAVTATDEACELATTSVTAGAIQFDVTNEGTRTTEFYIYESDGQTIVDEVEDITPAATRSLTADLESGSYEFACKPGGSGEGIRGTLTVS